MRILEAVGLRTKELLQERNMSQYRLIKIAKFNEKTIPEIIKGKTTDIKISSIFRIACALNVTLEEFFASPLFDEKNIDKIV